MLAAEIVPGQRCVYVGDDPYLTHPDSRHGRTCETVRAYGHSGGPLRGDEWVVRFERSGREMVVRPMDLELAP